MQSGRGGMGSRKHGRSGRSPKSPKLRHAMRREAEADERRDKRPALNHGSASEAVEMFNRRGHR